MLAKLVSFTPTLPEVLCKCARISSGLLAIFFIGWHNCCIASESIHSKPDRPNVLFISIDDLRPELKCYGAKHMLTPNMDRLSTSGVTFDRCYVQVAVCNPSRASTWTGLRPDHLGVWTLPVHFREAMPDAVTLPQHLRRHGYTCEGYGKIFHNPWPDPRSWDRPHAWGNKPFTHYNKDQKEAAQKVRDTYPENSWHRKHLRGLITNDADIADSEHTDGALTLKSIERLKELHKEKKPFFLAVGYILPHLPWTPPKSWWDKYDRASLPLPANPYPPKGAPAIALGTNYELSHYADMVHMPKPSEGTINEAETRRLLHGYFASVSYIDAQVGLLLDALEKEGLARNTVVILWSDHGYKLGEHNGWSKMTNYEIDTRIPFIIRDPKAKANGKRSKRIIESLDIFPTICELTATPLPKNLDGKSVAHLLNDPDATHTGAAFSQYIWPPLIGNAIRTNNWRYVEWRDLKDGQVKHRELYDHRADPGENLNVAEKQDQIVTELSKKLSKILPPQKVTLRSRIHSTTGGKRKKITWKNEHSGPVGIAWINFKGERKATQTLAAGKSSNIDTYSGHVFSIESKDGLYHEHITVTEDGAIYTLNNKAKEKRTKSLK